MAAKLTLRYDREADILYVDRRPPYSEQETEELGDDVLVRVDPVSGQIDSLEILFFSTRLLRSTLVELPIEANLVRSSES